LELIITSYSIGQNLYHLEWCPKYRYNMFRREENKKLCKYILHDIAKKYHITITEMRVMPYHIHMVVELPTTMSASQAFHLLRGVSARKLFKQKPNFRQRFPQEHFRSPGKFYRTVGDVYVETMLYYIREHQLQLQQNTVIRTSRRLCLRKCHKKYNLVKSFFQIFPIGFLKEYPFR